MSLSNQQNQQAAIEGTSTGEESNSKSQTLYFLPFAIQLQNIFPVEINARRFPLKIVAAPTVQLGATDIQIDTENRRAQAILELKVDFSDEPQPFAIFCKIVGEFIYTENYDAEKVYQFLEQGSLSVMLPFARELLLSLCTRMQIPPIMLEMVQLAPPPGTEANNESNPQEM